MTGQELHGLFLQVGVPHYETWHSWDHTSDRMRQAFDAVAETLNERQTERVMAEVAGEDT